MPRGPYYYPGAYWQNKRQDALIAWQSTNNNSGGGDQAKAAAVVFSPNGGSFANSVRVYLTSATPGATIYYTIDGSDPTTSSILYLASFFVTSTSTVKAIAVAPGYSTSDISTAAFTITVEQVNTPLFSPIGGSYPTAQNVTITSSNATSIRYTLDGSEPTVASTLYTAPVAISTTLALRAKGFAAGLLDSFVADANYTIGLPDTAAPVPVPTSGTSIPAFGGLEVSLSSATPGALIYYTLDGSTPTIASFLYSTPLVLTSTTTVKSFAVAPGYNDSTVTTATYPLEVTDMNGWWGSAGPTPPAAPDATYYLQAIFWDSTFSTWMRTFEDVNTVPYVMNFPAAPPANGSYRFYICQDSAPPIEWATNGAFALGPADFAGAAEGYNQFDQPGGFPCYTPTALQDGYPYRIYRLKLRFSGAATVTVKHVDELTP